MNKIYHYGGLADCLAILSGDLTNRPRQSQVELTIENFRSGGVRHFSFSV
jgi:hypothetical protein